MKSQVFISYCQQDEALYSSLCLALDGAAIRRWDVKKLLPGTRLSDELRAAIDECDVCVFLATSHSLESRWCLAELGAFWGAGKKVIVYLAEPGATESDLPPQLHGNLWTASAADLVRAIRHSGPGEVEGTENGYLARIGRMTLKVTLGRIETLDCRDETLLVALPANEFFDDECVHDSRSSLGAFMQHHFGGQISDMQLAVRNALEGTPTEQVAKRPGELAPSYGVGKCVFLNSPLSSGIRIAMVSITTQRANEGLRAEPLHLFEAAKALHCVMANHRLTRLLIPVLGTGHGGLKAETAFMCMLLAFGDLRCKGAQCLKEVEIVVFRRDPLSEPSISEGTIRRALKFVGLLLSDQ